MCHGMRFRFSTFPPGGPPYRPLDSRLSNSLYSDTWQSHPYKQRHSIRPVFTTFPDEQLSTIGDGIGDICHTPMIVDDFWPDMITHPYIEHQRTGWYLDKMEESLRRRCHTKDARCHTKGARCHTEGARYAEDIKNQRRTDSHYTDSGHDVRLEEKNDLYSKEENNLKNTKNRNKISEDFQENDVDVHKNKNKINREFEEKNVENHRGQGHTSTTDIKTKGQGHPDHKSKDSPRGHGHMSTTDIKTKGQGHSDHKSKDSSVKRKGIRLVKMDPRTGKIYVPENNVDNKYSESFDGEHENDGVTIEVVE